MHACACCICDMNKAHAHCDCCEAMYACVGVCVWLVKGDCCEAMNACVGVCMVTLIAVRLCMQCMFAVVSVFAPYEAVCLVCASVCCC